jgi:hypothetical protein
MQIPSASFKLMTSVTSAQIEKIRNMSAEDVKKNKEELRYLVQTIKPISDELMLLWECE